MNRYCCTSRPRPVHYWRWLVIAACIGWMAGNSHKAEVKPPKQGLAAPPVHCRRTRQGSGQNDQ